MHELLNRFTNWYLPPDWLSRTALLLAHLSLSIGLMYLANVDTPGFGALPVLIRSGIIPVWLYASIFIFGGAALFYSAMWDRHPRQNIIGWLSTPLILHAVTVLGAYSEQRASALVSVYLLVIFGMLILIFGVLSELGAIQRKMLLSSMDNEEIIAEEIDVEAIRLMSAVSGT